LETYDEPFDNDFSDDFADERVKRPGLLVLMAVFAPWIAPYDPTATDWGNVRGAPSLAHPFGGDEVGRDVLSRIIFGARASLGAGLVSVALAVSLGLPLGLLAGYAGGWIDGAISRLTEQLDAFAPSQQTGDHVASKEATPALPVNYQLVNTPEKLAHLVEQLADLHQVACVLAGHRLAHQQPDAERIKLDPRLHDQIGVHQRRDRSLVRRVIFTERLT